MAPLRLSTILWQERQLLDLRKAGASTDLALHIAELHRAVVVDGLRRDLELDGDVTLRTLAAKLPAPWPSVFDAHYDALTSVSEHRLPLSLAEFLR